MSESLWVRVNLSEGGLARIIHECEPRSVPLFAYIKLFVSPPHQRKNVASSSCLELRENRHTADGTSGLFFAETF